MILALGLLTMTGAHLALAGVLAKHWPYIAAFIGYSVLVLSGALKIAFTTMTVPATIESDFRSTWEGMYEHNKFRLYHIERAYGCCGFMNATDHAVPKVCKKSPEFGYEEGCFQFLKHETQVQWARAFAWTMGAALAQLVLLGIGAFVYARAGNGLHLDDEQEEYAPQDPERGWFVPERQAEREFLQQQQAGSITPTTDAPAVATLQVAVPGPLTQSPDPPQLSVIPTGLPAESQDAPPQKGNGIKLPEQIVRSSHGLIDHFYRHRTEKAENGGRGSSGGGKQVLQDGQR
ncbi:hypothetical protein DL89DRAFT_260475 [Linderina pennispora]|uniref:Tetraspanin Tsp3 n=1 Tax=Linderina pennispora TaxID=61395 RepID=A0A1Y1VY41_9FUNG|nr:uncharacterized protein DL89DRAFT_260475 [Linderina pennispora]ORX66181.1 hypothetical protein DL89DRAFT_260475 [Linderina pennispora]